MADPVSILTSCASLIGATGKTVSAIHSFVRSCRDARGDLTSVAGELTELQFTLELLKEDGQSDALKSSMQEQISQIVDECNGVVSNIRNTLRRCKGSSGAVMWAVNEKKQVEKLRKQLGVYRQSLSLTVEATGLSVTLSIKEDTQNIRNDTKLIPEMKNSFDTFLADIRKAQRSTQFGNLKPRSTGNLEDHPKGLTTYAETVVQEDMMQTTDGKSETKKQSVVIGNSTTTKHADGYSSTTKKIRSYSEVTKQISSNSGPMAGNSAPNSQADGDSGSTRQITGKSGPAGQITSNPRHARQISSNSAPTGQVDRESAPAKQITGNSGPTGQITSNPRPARQISSKSAPTRKFNGDSAPRQITSNPGPARQTTSNPTPSRQITGNSGPARYINGDSAPGQTTSNSGPSRQTISNPTADRQIISNSESARHMSGDSAPGQTTSNSGPSRQTISNPTPDKRIIGNSGPAKHIDGDSVPRQITSNSGPARQTTSSPTPGKHVTGNSTPTRQVSNNSTPTRQITDNASTDRQVIGNSGTIKAINGSHDQKAVTRKVGARPPIALPPRHKCYICSLPINHETVPNSGCGHRLCNNCIRLRFKASTEEPYPSPNCCDRPVPRWLADHVLDTELKGLVNKTWGLRIFTCRKGSLGEHMRVMLHRSSIRHAIGCVVCKKESFCSWCEKLYHEHERGNCQQIQRLLSVFDMPLPPVSE